jgi:uncharacterized protein YjbJ (UPF0337 family)
MKGIQAMSTATENKISGKIDEVAGKVKQSIGEVTHNDKVANEGAAQQVKGQAEQAWGSVKAAVSDATADAGRSAGSARARHENETGHKAHDVRESITSTAQNVKDQIQESIANHRAEHSK